MGPLDSPSRENLKCRLQRSHKTRTKDEKWERNQEKKRKGHWAIEHPPVKSPRNSKCTKHPWSSQSSGASPPHRSPSLSPATVSVGMARSETASHVRLASPSLPATCPSHSSTPLSLFRCSSSHLTTWPFFFLSDDPSIKCNSGAPADLTWNRDRQGRHAEEQSERTPLPSCCWLLQVAAARKARRS